MKSIEQYIREKLGHSDAPAEVDADDLWASIETQLAPASKKPAVVVWPWKRLFFALLFLVLGVLGGWFLLRDTDSVSAQGIPGNESTTIIDAEQFPSSTETNQLQENGPSSPTVSSIKTSTDKLSVSPPINTSSASITDHQEGLKSSKAGVTDESNRPVFTPQKTPVAPASAHKKETSPTRTKGNQAAAVIAPNKTKESQKTTTSTVTPSNVVKSEIEQVSIPAPNDNNPANSFTAEGENQAPETGEIEPLAVNEESNVLGTKAFTAITTLPSLSIKELVVTPLSLPLPTATPAKPFSRTMKNRFSFGLNAGANLLLTRYATPTDSPGEDLNAAIKPAAGSSFGIDIRYQLNKKFSLSTGLEYHRTLNTFEHITERDTMIDHPSPLNSGLIEAIRQQRVTDNLRTRYFTVPVLINWNQNLGNLRFGVGAGVALNFRQFANGTTLSPAGDFVPFDATTGPATTPKNFLSYQLSPSLAYRLKQESQLSLEAKADFRYVPFGTNDLSGTSRNSLLTGLSIGLRYNF